MFRLAVIATLIIYAGVVGIFNFLFPYLPNHWFTGATGNNHTYLVWYGKPQAKLAWLL